MAQALAIGEPSAGSLGDGALRGSAASWFVAAVAGQWLFVYFIAAFYGTSTARGQFEAWDRNPLLVGGHVAGDAIGNLAFASHALMAAIITFGGTLQLVPQIRDRALSIHRWNGRLFILSACAISVTGLYLTWIRGSVPSALGAVGASLNAALILFFAAMALRHALARDVAAHRRWALRTFLAVNGVWFFRVGLMAWLILNQGPRWVGQRFDGPFIMVWSFASYLVPLAVLELYLRAQDGSGARGKLAMAGGLFVLTTVMCVGIVGAFMFLWRPLL